MTRFLLLPLALLVPACAARSPAGPFSDGAPPPPPPGRALFVSPMGEPFRVPAPDRAWFAQADADHDGRLTAAEFRADADRFFTVLDTDRDGEIDPDEVAVYETTILPEIRATGPGRDGARGRGGPRGGGGGPGAGPGGGPGSGGAGGRGPGGPPPGGDAGGGREDAARGRQGAGRFGYLDLPEPVTAADRDFDRAIDRAEFARAADERFALLDRDRDGAITASELPRLHGPGGRGPDGRGPGGPGGPPPR